MEGRVRVEGEPVCCRLICGNHAGEGGVRYVVGRRLVEEVVEHGEAEDGAEFGGFEAYGCGEVGVGDAAFKGYVLSYAIVTDDL